MAKQKKYRIYYLKKFSEVYDFHFDDMSENTYVIASNAKDAVKQFLDNVNSRIPIQITSVYECKEVRLSKKEWSE